MFAQRRLCASHAAAVVAVLVLHCEARCPRGCQTLHVGAHPSGTPSAEPPETNVTPCVLLTSRILASVATNPRCRAMPEPMLITSQPSPTSFPHSASTPAEVLVLLPSCDPRVQTLSRSATGNGVPEVMPAATKAMMGASIAMGGVAGVRSPSVGVIECSLGEKAAHARVQWHACRVVQHHATATWASHCQTVSQSVASYNNNQESGTRAFHF